MPVTRVAVAGGRSKAGYYAIRGMLLVFLCVAAVFNVRMISGFTNATSPDLSAFNRVDNPRFDDRAVPVEQSPPDVPVANPVVQVNQAPAVMNGPVKVDKTQVDSGLPLTKSEEPLVVPVKRTRPRVRRTEVNVPPSVQPPAPPQPAPVQVQSSVDPSSLSAFVSSGGNLPIVVITRTRTDVLRQTLSSLLSVRGVSREAVFVVQDGTDEGTAAVVTSFGLRFHQKTVAPPVSLRGSAQDIGAERIALHFKYALEYMFDVVTDVSWG